MAVVSIPLKVMPSLVPAKSKGTLPLMAGATPSSLQSTWKQSQNLRWVRFLSTTFFHTLENIFNAIEYIQYIQNIFNATSSA